MTQMTTAIKPERMPVAVATGKPLNVLILEDNADDTDLVLHALSRAGFATEWTRVDAEADFIAALDSSLDVILSDYNLPQFTGLRALEVLQERGLDIPFIIVTGAIDDEEAVTAMRRGATDYLFKDRMARLGEAVRRALHGRLLREQTRAAEQALRDQQAFLSSLLDHAPMPISVTTPDLRYRMVNRAWEDTFQIPRTGVIGKALHDLLPETTAASITETSRLVIKTGSTVVREEIAETPHGRRFYDAVKFPLRDGDGEMDGIGHIAIDITDRKRAQSTLREVVTRANCLLWYATVTLTDGVYAWDLHPFDEEAALRFIPIQIEPSAPYSHSFGHARLPEDREAMDRRAQEALAEGKPGYQQEFRCRDRDGRIRWLYESVFIEPTGPQQWRLVGVCTDMTERKAAEEALRRSEESYRLLFDRIPHPALIVSAETDRFVEANAAATKHYGYTHDEFLELSIGHLCRDGDCQACIEASNGGSAGQTAPLQARHRRRDGTFMTVEVTCHDVDFDGHRARLMITTDITARQEAEAALRNSESLYHSLVESLPLSLFRKDLDGRFTFGNRRFAAAMGASDFSSIRGKTDYDCFSYDLADKYRADDARVISTGKVFEDTEKFVGPSGNRLYMAVQKTPYRDADGSIVGVQGNFWDVTESKLAAERQDAYNHILEMLTSGKSLEETLGALVEVVGDHQPGAIGSIWLLDDDGRRLRPFVAPDFGAVWERLRAQGMPVGRKASPTGLAAYHKRLVVISDVDTATDLSEEYRKIAAECEIRACWSHPIEASSGDVVGAFELAFSAPREPSAQELAILDWAARLTGVAVERVRAREALRESEERFRHLIEQGSDVITIIDADGVIRYASPSVLRILGYEPHEVIGSSGFALVHPDEVDAVRSLLDDRAAGNGTGSTVSYRIRHRDGSWRYMESLSTRLFDRPGIRGLVLNSRDITERRLASQAIESQARRLAESNAELEQFAYVASHDLQEPLRMVSGYTQLLARRYKGKLDDDADEFINYAVDGVTRMQTLINDLLAYARVGSRGKDFELVACEDVLADAVMNLQVAIEDSNATITHEALPAVNGDGGQLVQLFQNIIGNGIKFRRVDVAPHVHVTAERSGEGWLFKVSDNGIGIEESYRERVFIIFQRLQGKTEYPGTGIGLAICKKIVKRHQGQIWIESEPGEGTTFLFTVGTEPD